MRWGENAPHHLNPRKNMQSLQCDNLPISLATDQNHRNSLRHLCAEKASWIFAYKGREKKKRANNFFPSCESVAIFKGGIIIRRRGFTVWSMNAPSQFRSMQKKTSKCIWQKNVIYGYAAITIFLFWNRLYLPIWSVTRSLVSPPPPTLSPNGKNHHHTAMAAAAASAQAKCQIRDRWKIEKEAAAAVVA